MQTHRQRLQSRFGLETASDGSGSVNTTTPHYARGFAEKKGDTEEEAEAKKKKVTGTTVTTLPAADLRFLKLRRRPDSECNVPITFDRDEKLREMFTRLDHEGRGFIYLKELKEASEFVEKRMKATKELVRANGAKSLYQVFQDMDTNHDGFLTNNEFVNAMTGTRRGAFENLSEDDIEQVKFLYVHFGVLKKREAAVKSLDTMPPPIIRGLSMRSLNGGSGGGGAGASTKMKSPAKRTGAGPVGGSPAPAPVPVGPGGSVSPAHKGEDSLFAGPTGPPGSRLVRHRESAIARNLHLHLDEETLQRDSDRYKHFHTIFEPIFSVPDADDDDAALFGLTGSGKSPGGSIKKNRSLDVLAEAAGSGSRYTDEELEIALVTKLAAERERAERSANSTRRASAFRGAGGGRRRSSAAGRGGVLDMNALRRHSSLQPKKPEESMESITNSFRRLSLARDISSYFDGTDGIKEENEDGGVSGKSTAAGDPRRRFKESKQKEKSMHSRSVATFISSIFDSKDETKEAAWKIPDMFKQQKKMMEQLVGFRLRMDPNKAEEDDDADSSDSDRDEEAEDEEDEHLRSPRGLSTMQEEGEGDEEEEGELQPGLLLEDLEEEDEGRVDGDVVEGGAGAAEGAAAGDGGDDKAEATGDPAPAKPAVAAGGAEDESGEPADKGEGGDDGAPPSPQEQSSTSAHLAQKDGHSSSPGGGAGSGAGGGAGGGGGGGGGDGSPTLKLKTKSVRLPPVPSPTPPAPAPAPAPAPEPAPELSAREKAYQEIERRVWAERRAEKIHTLVNAEARERQRRMDAEKEFVLSVRRRALEACETLPSPQPKVAIGVPVPTSLLAVEAKQDALLYAVKHRKKANRVAQRVHKKQLKKRIFEASQAHTADGGGQQSPGGAGTGAGAGAGGLPPVSPGGGMGMGWGGVSPTRMFTSSTGTGSYLNAPSSEFYEVESHETARIKFFATNQESLRIRPRSRAQSAAQRALQQFQDGAAKRGGGRLGFTPSSLPGPHTPHT